MLSNGKKQKQTSPLKTMRTMIVSALFRQLGSCFGLFNIAG
jgi:hypothetical protein